VLFFDEADALFGSRTDVKDSHDRFDNAGTDYLLKRIEAYSGIAVLATNVRFGNAGVLAARFRHVLEFPPV
jgi:hypothetical protein